MNTVNATRTGKARTSEATVNFIGKPVSADVAPKTKELGHVLSINAQEFAQSLKDASLYASKDDLCDNAMSQILLLVMPKIGKLAVIGCDGLGYYERRLSLPSGKRKPSLPGDQNTLCISLKDAALLARFIPARDNSALTIEAANEKDGCYSVRVSLQNGASTTFLSKSGLAIPDYDKIKANAEKGRKKSQSFESLFVPVRELLRAGRVFPGKSAFARMFATRGISKGVMALLECKNETADISVIFMLNQDVDQSAWKGE